MIRKYLTVLGVAASYFVQAQDISVLKNAADVYSDIQVAGTSKSNAMAGALGALGGDISSVNSNPAGIGVYITNDFGSVKILEPIFANFIFKFFFSNIFVIHFFILNFTKI